MRWRRYWKDPDARSISPRESAWRQAWDKRKAEEEEEARTRPDGMICITIRWKGKRLLHILSTGLNPEAERTWYQADLCDITQCPSDLGSSTRSSCRDPGFYPPL